MKYSAFIVSGMLVVTSFVPARAAAIAHQINLFTGGEGGYHAYRIPAILKAPDGSLIAVAEARRENLGDPGSGDIDLVYKRSTDSGATWTDQAVLDDPGDGWAASNPTMVVDQNTSRVWLLYNRWMPGYGLKNATPGAMHCQGWVRHSDDNGATWSEPVDITAETRDVDAWGSMFFGPGHGVQLPSGRLVIPATAYVGGGEGKDPERRSGYAAYSDDGGATWTRGELVPGDVTDENEFVVLGPETLLMVARQVHGNLNRLVRSTDGGQAWQDPVDGVEVTPVMTGLSKLDDGTIVWSSPKGPNRNNLVLRFSRDGGQTFGEEELIYEGPAAYSDLALLDQNNLAILWERGTTQRYQFITFTHVVLNGQASAAPPVATMPAASTAPTAPTAGDLAIQPVTVNHDPGPEYADSTRQFQGIPGIERAPNGRLWATWYGGGDNEGPLNYVMLVTSDDDGATWSDLQLVIDPPENVRAFDPCLWHDPIGRLWLFWAQGYSHWDGRAGVWAITTEDSEDARPQWSAPTRITDGIMMNKPTVLSDGTWLLPVSVWHRDPDPENPTHQFDMGELDGANVIATKNRGQSFELWGQAQSDAPLFDEHSIIARHDGSLWMLLRTRYGIGQTVSTDMGKTWAPVEPSGIDHVSARFFISRLRSGKLLLVKHSPPEMNQRSHLTAYLSSDDGVSWQGGLMIDERNGVSYPDAVQTQDGVIYLIYDYSRRDERQILMAMFTEEDVESGEWKSSVARERILVNQARDPE